VTTLSIITPPQFTRLVWWLNFDSLASGDWLAAVDVLWFDTAVSFQPGDWLKLHQLIEAYNAKSGRTVKVIRRLAKYLVPDKLDATFDEAWKHQLAFTDIGDEEEDKQRNPDGSPANIFSTPQPIIDYFAAAANEARAALPGVPVIANFNGTHLQPGLKANYDRIVRGAKLDAVCSDSYPNANQQADASGKLLYPDLIAEAVNGPTLLRQWYPDLKVYGFVDTCNEQLFQQGAPGWIDGMKAVGSRAWTPAEWLSIVGKFKVAGLNGVAYFPQQRNGAVNDATDPALWPAIRQVGGVPALPAGGVAGSGGTSAEPNLAGWSIVSPSGKTFILQPK
jgi:hypothetical protein